LLNAVARAVQQALLALDSTSGAIVSAATRGCSLIVACAARALGDWAFGSLWVEAVAIDRQLENVASARAAAHLGGTRTGSRRVRVGGAEAQLERYTLAGRSE
jgi:hypothetical protein